MRFVNDQAYGDTFTLVSGPSGTSASHTCGVVYFQRYVRESRMWRITWAAMLPDYSIELNTIMVLAVVAAC